MSRCGSSREKSAYDQGHGEQPWALMRPSFDGDNQGRLGDPALMATAGGLMFDRGDFEDTKTNSRNK